MNPTESTILVTGGLGFIGSNMVRHLLLETGDQVVNLDKIAYSGNPESLKDLQDHPKYRFEQGDIADRPTVDRIFQKYRPDAVLHLAAESHVDRSIDEPSAFITTNIVGTYQLLHSSLKHWQSLDANRKKAFRFLHVSTDEVFGSLGPEDPAFNENTSYDPRSPYSASKASSDFLVRSWHHTYGFPVLISNCSNNYGPFQFPEKLIPVVILKALQGQAIPVYGQGENIRDWLYVEDHCRALLAILKSGSPGETYAIGGDNEIRNIDLVRNLCGFLDELKPLADSSSYSDLITFVTDRPGHDMRYAIDASKIQRDLGWKPKEKAATGFRKTVEWYLTHATWWQPILDGTYQLQRLGHSK